MQRRRSAPACPQHKERQHNEAISDGGARHWAIANTLIATAKLNGVEPLAYLTDVLERVVSGRTRAHELHSLLPWNWQSQIGRPHECSSPLTSA